MPSSESLILAAITGVGFGAVLWYLHSTVARSALILFVLWVLQTVSQQLLRALENDLSLITRELVIVSTVRLAFYVSALVSLWLLLRWRPRRGLVG